MQLSWFNSQLSSLWKPWHEQICEGPEALTTPFFPLVQLPTQTLWDIKSSTCHILLGQEDMNFITPQLSCHQEPWNTTGSQQHGPAALHALTRAAGLDKLLKRAHSTAASSPGARTEGHEYTRSNQRRIRAGQSQHLSWGWTCTRKPVLARSHSLGFWLQGLCRYQLTAWKGWRKKTNP